MKVLVYNLMFNKLAATTKACSALGAELIQIKTDQLHDSIESLTGAGPNIKPGMDGDMVPKELMVFSGFTSDDMERFLTTYNSTGIPKVIFKAMVTPINLRWSPAYLYEHLIDEVNS